MAAPQHDAIITVGVELLGVSVLALIAGISDDVGEIVVTLMVGIAFIWAITNASALTSLVGKFNGTAPPSGTVIL